MTPACSETDEHEALRPDPEALLKLARTRMPFGRYKDWLLIDLPEPYLVWFRRTGFPKGSLGKMLESVYEIKANGLEYLFNSLRPPDAGPSAYRNEERAEH